jgi:hypothetical protein
MMRIIEKILLEFIKNSDLMQTGDYQTGFKEEKTTLIHVKFLIDTIMQYQMSNRKLRKIFVFIDFKKAYDSVKRHLLFQYLIRKAGDDAQKAWIIKWIYFLHKEGEVEID